MRIKKPTASQCPSSSSIIRCSFFTSALNQLLMMYIYIYTWSNRTGRLRLLYIHCTKLHELKPSPPFNRRRKKPRPGPVPSAPSAQPTERRSGAEVADLRGNKNPQNNTKHIKNMQEPWKQQADLASYFLLDWMTSVSIIHHFKSISMSTVKICKVFLKIDLWSFLISWRVPFFCRLPRDKSWTCCVSQTKRSTDWQDLTRVDTFWCQTTSEMWVIYVEVLRSILRTFLVFDLSNTLTLINLNVTIRSIQ